MPSLKLFASARNDDDDDDDDVARPLGLLPPPANEYSLYWTSKLIRRDLKNRLKETKKKIESVFRSRRSVDIAASTIQNPSKKDASTEPAIVKNKKSCHIKKPSNDTTIETASPSIFSTSVETSSTSVTNASVHSTDVQVPTTIPQILETNNFYTLMSDKWQLWREQRPFGLPHQDRFRNRGIAVFLSIAIELCPSNPIYDMFRVDQDPGRTSKLPAAPYSNKANTSVRYDSAHSTASPSYWPATQIQGGTPWSEPDATTRIWGALLVALTDRSITVKFVESLLGRILPGVDSDEFLIRAGDPARRLREGEDEAIREKLRPLLFPDYEQLF